MAHIDLIAPLIIQRDHKKELLGALVFIINPEHFLYPLIQDWPTPSPTAETLLVQEEGDRVLFLNPLWHRQNPPLSITLPLDSPQQPAAWGLKGHKGIYEGLDYRNVPVLAVTKPISGTSWYIEAKVDKEEVFADLQLEGKLIAAGVFTLVLLAGTSMGWALTGQRKGYYKELFRLENERRALLAHFEYLVKYANDIILLMDQDGNLKEANDRAVQTYGYDREALLRLNIRDLMGENEAPALERWGQGDLAAGGNVFECCHRRRDGRTIPVEVSVNFIQLEGKDYFQEIIRDITERKQAEEALRESEERHRTLVENIDLGISVINKDYKVLMINAAQRKLLQRPTDEFVDRNCFREFEKRDAVCPHCPGTAAMATGQKHAVELAVPRDDGTRFDIRINAFPYFASTGEITGYIEVTEDITERKRAEEELRLAAQKWRATFDAIGDGVCLLDGGNTILQCNQAMTKFVGKPFPEIIGRKCWEVVHQTDRPTDGCPFMCLKNTKLRETILLAHDDRWFKITVDPILNEDGGLLGVVHIISDVTHEKQMEQSLIESFQKLKRAFSSTVQVLSTTVETRDPYTAGHQKRVAQLASAIAEELGFSREQLEGMYVLGCLHDIGKIGVPAEILSRPGKISPMEFNIIKTHPQIGYDILKDMEFPWPVAQAVLQHHERLDGSGYPQGLTEPDIIIEARILAVADVVEAMASHRPYRPSLGIEKALEEITKNKNKFYDPEVVEACVKLCTEKGFHLDREL